LFSWVVAPLEGANDTVIADGKGLSTAEAKRLEDLIKKYGMPEPIAEPLK
jgi:hypothetical protein